MAEKKIKELGSTIKVDPLLASEAIELYGEMMRIAGHATGRLPALIYSLHQPDDGEKMMGDVAALAAISDVLNKVGPTGVRDFIKRVTECAMVHTPSGDWRQLDFDGDFTGNLGAILPVAKFVLEVNFADFFPASGGIGILNLLREGLAKRK